MRPHVKEMVNLRLLSNDVCILVLPSWLQNVRESCVTTANHTFFGAVKSKRRMWGDMYTVFAVYIFANQDPRVS